MEEIISLPEIMFHPSRMRKRQFYDEILSTLTTEPIQEVDASVSEAVSARTEKKTPTLGFRLFKYNPFNFKVK